MITDPSVQVISSIIGGAPHRMLQTAASAFSSQPPFHTDAPAFHTDHLVSSFWPRGFKRRSVTLEDRFPAATCAELERRGHAVTPAGGWTEGRLPACSATVVDGMRVLGAAANPRMMQGYALAR